MSGLEFLHAIKRQNAALPVVVMTAFGTVETAVEAMKAGASDYVLKPFSLNEMRMVIRKELDVHNLREENRSLREALGKRYAHPNIVARSPKMQEVLATVDRVASTNSTVLLGGESGVGKDLIARAIHERSRRAAGPFIKINSTAIPENLLESELFGYEKGAFTGASNSKPGKFELADKGTLFLDEIGDVPPVTQVKLLRVLQEREFERLGGTRTIKVDVRLIAATNRDLREALEQGTFREDLYYRLNVVPIDIAPLRQRKEDIPLLAASFLKRYAEENDLPPRTLAPEAMRVLMDYDWPGNVRELENVIERGVVLSSTPSIGFDLLPGHLTGRSYSSSLLEHNPDASLFDILEDIERRIIIDKLERCKWNQTDAAEQFRIPLSTLNQKIKRLSIEIKKRLKD
jgi:DNA-binding NtrC family response regulator